jgi:ubiquinone/menaquinone biosynthesis C-methylase UbiE
VVENANISKQKVKRTNELIDLYTKMSLSAEQREFNRFKELDFVSKKYGLPSLTPDCALDLGAGMGPALPQLAGRFNHVLAVDISLKHLIMARKRCQERSHQNVTFVCACAEKLPVTGNYFSFVNSADVLEHVADSETYLREIERVLKPQGILWASTPNRFTILPEGHVKLWGVGFLPRAVQEYYVGLIGRTAYRGIRPISYIEVNKLLRSVFKRYEIILPVDINEIIEPHPAIEPNSLWKVARAYWKFINKHRTMRRIGNLLEKTFYPQFRFFAIKV